MAETPQTIDPAELPQTITSYLKAHQARDLDVAMQSYEPGAAVTDEDRGKLPWRHSRSSLPLHIAQRENRPARHRALAAQGCERRGRSRRRSDSGMFHRRWPSHRRRRGYPRHRGYPGVVAGAGNEVPVLDGGA